MAKPFSFNYDTQQVVYKEQNTWNALSKVNLEGLIF
jgi:hypothetical protein